MFGRCSSLFQGPSWGGEEGVVSGLVYIVRYHSGPPPPPPPHPNKQIRLMSPGQAKPALARAAGAGSRPEMDKKVRTRGGRAVKGVNVNCARRCYDFNLS